ncbi:MAG: TlpA family protein disulfide reductase [Acidimicrobiia bacterium]
MSAIVFTAIGLALVAAVIFGTGGAPSDFSFGTPEISGEELPRPNRAGDPGIGLPAPVVIGEDFDALPVSIEPDGTAKGIVFLAHWCPHCQAEVPRVQNWLDNGGGVAGTEIVTVVTAFDETRVNYPPNDWLTDESWTPRVVVDDANSSILAAFGQGGFPYWVFVNGDGIVTSRTEGELTIDQLAAHLGGAAAS